MMTCMHFQSPSSKGERVVGAARDPFRVFVFSVLPLNEPDFLTTRPGPGRNRAPTMLPGPGDPTGGAFQSQGTVGMKGAGAKLGTPISRLARGKTPIGRLAFPGNMQSREKCGIESSRRTVMMLK